MLLLAVCPLNFAEALRTQAIQLQQGWNAVFLEVAPSKAAPHELFANVPVDTVAAFTPTAKPVYYPRDPEKHPWQEEGWAVWYAPHRPDAFLTDLQSIRGNRAYLIHASAAHLWQVEGKIAGGVIRWEPNSFTLTGFSLEPEAPPTFAQFFGGSKAHRGQRIFRLVNDRWTAVRDPATTRMRSGEAYWIYSKGGSQFQGPLHIGGASANRLAFGGEVNGLRLELSNAGDSAAHFLVETVPVGGSTLPLSYEVRDFATLTASYPSLPGALTLAALEPRGGRQTLRLYVRREEMGQPSQSGLLRISNGQGSVRWIAVETAHPGPF